MPNPALAQKYIVWAGGLLGLAFNYLTVIKGQKIGCMVFGAYAPEFLERNQVLERILKLRYAPKDLEDTGRNRMIGN